MTNLDLDLGGFIALGPGRQTLSKVPENTSLCILLNQFIEQFKVSLETGCFNERELAIKNCMSDELRAHWG